MIAILAVTGLILIYLEFFLPGAIMGIGGTVMLITSLLLFYFQTPQIAHFIAFAFGLAIALLITIRFAIWRVKKAQLLLSTDQEGYQASMYPKELIGKTAFTSSDLKPSGYIEIDGKNWAALSKLGYIDRGQSVRVVGGQGNYLIVSQEKNHHVTNSNGAGS